MKNYLKISNNCLKKLNWKILNLRLNKKMNKESLSKIKMLNKKLINMKEQTPQGLKKPGGVKLSSNLNLLELLISITLKKLKIIGMNLSKNLASPNQLNKWSPKKSKHLQMVLSRSTRYWILINKKNTSHLSQFLQQQFYFKS